MPHLPLLQTKLHVPPTRPELVLRPRLISHLNEGLGCKLTLISAPAGFGKTTLVSEWLDCLKSTDSQASPAVGAVAWLSLDGRDSDQTRFLAYLLAALRSMGHGIGEGALSALQYPNPPPTEAILITLINEIAAVPAQMVIVLDDYHLIDDHTVHDTIDYLIKHFPPNMHLVIVTREDPPLPLTRLRAGGQMTEVRVGDLRFTSSEAAEFLNRKMELDLLPEQVESLETRTEGWIAGLQLAALALQGTLSKRGREDASGFVRAFAGDNRYIMDYLVEEVLQRRTERIRRFLLQTSILDRMTGTLCDAVCFGYDESSPELDEGRSVLEALERDNLFVVPLDDKRNWYRYHHLFAEVLQAHLREEQPDRIPVLHRRASQWYEHNDLPAESIRHALAAGDFERAADLAEMAWPAWSGSYQSIAWRGWLKGLPDQIVRNRPVLCVSYAWSFLNAGMLEKAEIWLQRAERWLAPSAGTGVQPEDGLPAMVVVDEDQFRALPVSLAAARAYHAQAIGDHSVTLKSAQRVLDLAPDGADERRGDATALLGLAHWASGDLKDAHDIFSAGLAGMKPLAIIIGTFVLADIKATLGQLDEAVRTCEHALQLALQHGEPMPLGTEDVYTGLSKLHRERGDLEAAAETLQAAELLGQQIELPDWRYRWCVAQSQLQKTLGNLDGALDLLDEAERVYVRTPLPDLWPIAAMKVRIWITQGRMAEALAWARERSLSVDDDLSYQREFEHITLARVLISRYEIRSEVLHLQEAIGLLGRLLRAADEGERIGSVIEILVLQALAYQARGDIPNAQVHLERALALAEPQGYVHIFVDEGQPMERLLQQVARQCDTTVYAQRIQAAFEKHDDSKLQAQPLIEPLSERELEVLHLISLGLSNREIGQRLFIALNTVKGHNRSIFGKLGVKRRTEAVASARELNLLQ